MARTSVDLTPMRAALSSCLVALVLAACAPPPKSVEPHVETKGASSESGNETITQPSWFLSVYPEEKVAIPPDYSPPTLSDLPQVAAAAHCLEDPAVEPPAVDHPCPDDIRAELLSIFREHPVWVAADPKMEATYGTIPDLIEDQFIVEMAQGKAREAGRPLTEDQVEKRKEEMARRRADFLASLPQVERSRPELEQQVARDSRLRKLSACAALPAGYIENLRAELMHECTALFAQTLRSKKVFGAQRAEMEGRLLARQILRLKAPEFTLRRGSTAFDASLRIKDTLGPQLRQYGDRLQKIRLLLAARPHSPGRTLALATLFTSAWRLNHRLPKSLEKQSEIRSQFYEELYGFLLSDGTRAEEERARLEELLLKSLLHEGALYSRSALMIRNQGSLGFGSLLRESVRPPASKARPIFELLPTPHFAEAFAPNGKQDLLALFRGGVSASQLGDLHALTARLLKERAVSNPGALPPSAGLRVLLRHLGEQHLARAILFESKSDAKMALEILKPLALDDNHRADLALAQVLAKPSSGKKAMASEGDNADVDASEFLKLEDPAARARLLINRGSQPQGSHVQFLRAFERPCYRNDMAPYKGPSCRKFDWLWPASKGK